MTNRLDISQLCNPPSEEETPAPFDSTIMVSGLQVATYSEDIQDQRSPSFSKVQHDAQATVTAPPGEQYPTPESPAVAPASGEYHTLEASSLSDTEPNPIEDVQSPPTRPQHHPGWTAVNLRLPPVSALRPCICTGSYGSPYCPRVIGSSYKPTFEKEPALDEGHDTTVQDDPYISRLPPAFRRSLERDERVPQIAQHPDKIMKKQQQKVVKRRQEKKRPHNELEKALFPSLDKAVGMRANSPEPGLTQLDYGVLSRLTG